MNKISTPEEKNPSAIAVQQPIDSAPPSQNSHGVPMQSQLEKGSDKYNSKIVEATDGPAGPSVQEGSRTSSVLSMQAGTKKTDYLDRASYREEIYQRLTKNKHYTRFWNHPEGGNKPQTEKFLSHVYSGYILAGRVYPKFVPLLDPKSIDPKKKMAIKELTSYSEILEKSSYGKQHPAKLSKATPRADHTFSVGEVLEDAERVCEILGGSLNFLEIARSFYPLTRGRLLPSELISEYLHAASVYNTILAPPEVRFGSWSILRGWACRIKLHKEEYGKANPPSRKETYGELRRYLNADYGITVNHKDFKLAPGLQGRGLRPILFAAQDRLYARFGVETVTTVAGFSMGRYVWALDYFDARETLKPPAVAQEGAILGLANIKNELQSYLSKEKVVEWLHSRGYGADELKQFKASIEQANSMREIATLGFPTSDGRIDIASDDLEPLNLKLGEHRPGRYSLGKLVLLGVEILSWYAIKDYSKTGPDAVYNKTRVLYENSFIKKVEKKKGRKLTLEERESMLRFFNNAAGKE